MGASDARFEHAAAPDGNAVALTHIVHRSRFAVSSNSPQLDIDNATRADFDGLARIVRRVNRLIEADRSSDLALKLGMVDHVLVVQRLFEHHHLEVIHPPEEVDIVERVCGIGIAHQQNLWKGGSHLPHGGSLWRAVTLAASIATGIAVLMASARVLRIAEFDEAFGRVLRRLRPAG